jgi:outer membrane protein assembly factor BamB
MIRTILMTFLFLASSCSTLYDMGLRGDKPQPESFQISWAKNNDPVHKTGNLPIALNSPYIYEGIVYVGHNAGGLRAYELETGNDIWKSDELGPYHGKPVGYKNQIIYGNAQGRVYSRHYLTGKLKYSVELDASIETQGVVYKGRIIYQLRNHKIFCLDIATGKVLWAYRRSVPFITSLQRASRPLAINNKLYVGFADGVIAAFSIEEGIILWEKKLSNSSKFIDVDMTPVYYDKKIFVGSLDGPMTVLRPDTGSILRKFDFSVSRSPIKNKESLIIGTIKGELVEIDSQQRIVRRKKVSDVHISSLIKWKNNFVLSNVKGELILVNSKTFEVMGTHSLGHSTSSVFGELEVSDGKLAVLSSRNRLYIFK